MFRASRIRHAKLPVRPVLNINPTPPPPKRNSSPPTRQISPIGLGFILGGLALGVYLFKPSSRLPTAAIDTFKPQVAIVFGLGDSHDVFWKSANQLGFAYIDVRHDLKKLDELVKGGTTKFFIEGFASVGELEQLAQTTVQPDAILTFGDYGEISPRQIQLHDPSCDKIGGLLRERNLV